MSEGYPSTHFLFNLFTLAIDTKTRFSFNEQVTAFVRISFGLRYRLQVFCEFVTLD